MKKEINDQSGELDIISRTQNVIELYISIMTEQLNEKKYFMRLIFYTSIEFLDHKAFRDSVLKMHNSKSPVINATLKDIFDNANLVVGSFPDLVQIKADETLPHLITTWRITKPWLEERLDNETTNDKPHKEPEEEEHSYENDAFIGFCFKIARSLKPLFPKNKIHKEEKTFPDYLVTIDPDDRIILAKYLETFLKGAGGKRIACVLLVLEKLSKISLYLGSRASLYKALKIHYGITDKCSNTSINNFLKQEIWGKEENKKEFQDVQSKVSKFLHEKNIE